jgi:hypothetical protein
MDRTGRWALAGLVTFFAVLAAQYFYGPPPPNLASVTWAGHAQWLLVAWGYWIDAHARGEPAAAVRLAGAASMSAGAQERTRTSTELPAST